MNTTELDPQSLLSGNELDRAVIEINGKRIDTGHEEEP